MPGLIHLHTKSGSSTVSTSLTNSAIASNLTSSNAIIQATSGGTVKTAAKLQNTVSITDNATAPPAWAVCREIKESKPKHLL